MRFWLDTQRSLAYVGQARLKVLHWAMSLSPKKDIIQGLPLPSDVNPYVVSSAMFFKIIVGFWAKA